ncbi:aldehyde dehydrogenase family protein, partial [Rhizorhabdus sp.]|uniref:aldehyde dehydrogenase family protein n=1 Tax=Rhizorhabdus sp. TaxID=1968843 RepID=UPI0035B4B6F4
MHSLDPATGETVWEGEATPPGRIPALVETARKALPAWADRPLDDRIAILRRYAEILTERTETLARDISRETGKPLWESRAELGSMTAKVGVSITAQAERAGSRQTDTGFGRAVLRHRPHGVMAVLGPYN